jgi:ubiquinol-cytochrome c reductase cytochrome b subunit
MTPLFARIFASLDERVGLAQPGRKALNKIFPNHWSFLLGEIAMISFLILVVTGIFLTAFYRPSVEPVTYTGASALYDGRELPAAFASVLSLTHDIPGGQLVRRVHRATATVFIGVAILHMLRVLLTGAFRKPREINYHIGWIMLVLAVVSGWSGHNLIWDALAGTSVRVYYSFVLATPYIGEWLAQLIFAGEFPTTGFLPRMYALHVLVLPGAIGALFALHMTLVVRQTHTAFRHPAVDVERSVPGEPMWPSQFAKTTTLGLMVAGVIALAAALVPWSEVDLHGPYIVAQAPNATQPDWFLFWIEGAIRIYPAIDVEIPGSFISGPFVAGILLPIFFILAMAFYPWLERHVVGDDRRQHHTAQGGLEVPFRAGFVAAFTSFWLLLSIAAANDVIARVFGIPVEAVVWSFRVAVLVAPPLIGLAVAWWARYRGQRVVDAQ